MLFSGAFHDAIQQNEQGGSAVSKNIKKKTPIYKMGSCFNLDVLSFLPTLHA